jgi:hypothetical protein
LKRDIMKRHGKFDDSLSVPLWVWCFLGLVFWQVLLWAQSPSILMDDSGEMVAASWNLGLPHPPGYPLFDLLGHVFSWLPVGTVAFRFNLMSSVIVLFSLVFLLKTCVALAARFKSKKNSSDDLIKPLLAVTALAFLSCGTVFSQCLSAKGCVYTLTLLILSVLIWMRVSGFKGKRIIYAAWFLWGLGLANHWQTIILLAPFVIFLTVWESGLTVKNIAFIWFFSILGLSLYLYLPLRAALTAQPSWGFPLHWTEFKWVVFRQLVAGEEMKIHPFGFYGEALAAIVAGCRVWMPGMMLAAAAGLFAIFRFEKALFRDFLILFLPIVLALAAVHETNNLYLMPVYLLPLAGLTALLSFAGLFWLLSKGGFAFQKTMVLVLILFSVFWGWTVFENQNKNRFTLVEDFGVNVLKCLPKGAVLLADGDNYVMPLWYVKTVDHLRPDVVVEPTVFLYHEWGWNQLGLQAEDLKTDQAQPPSERFVGLMKNPNHRFFYSFGRQFFPGELNQMGHWTHHGLADGWTALPVTAGDDAQAQRLSGLERIRGIEENRDAAIADPPTHDLYASYALQGMDESAWYLNHHDELKALSRLESVLYFQPQWPGVYADMASMVESMGYGGMARNLCQMSIEANPKDGLSYAVLARLDKEKTQDKDAREYGHLSEILEKAGCPFLSRLAFQESRPGTKTLN